MPTDYPVNRVFTSPNVKMSFPSPAVNAKVEDEAFDYFDCITGTTEKDKDHRMPKTWLPNAKYILGNVELSAMKLCHTHRSGYDALDFEQLGVDTDRQPLIQVVFMERTKYDTIMTVAIRRHVATSAAGSGSIAPLVSSGAATPTKNAAPTTKETPVVVTIGPKVVSTGIPSVAGSGSIPTASQPMIAPLTPPLTVDSTVVSTARGAPSSRGSTGVRGGITGRGGTSLRGGVTARGGGFAGRSGARKFASARPMTGGRGRGPSVPSRAAPEVLVEYVSESSSSEGTREAASPPQRPEKRPRLGEGGSTAGASVSVAMEPQPRSGTGPSARLSTFIEEVAVPQPAPLAGFFSVKPVTPGQKFIPDWDVHENESLKIDDPATGGTLAYRLWKGSQLPLDRPERMVAPAARSLHKLRELNDSMVELVEMYSHY